MASSEIIIRQEVRPCMVFYWRRKAEQPGQLGEEELVEVKGVWHMWRDDGREGIVELEDGHIVYPEPKYVRFLDSEEKFSEYAWEG